MFSDLLQDLSEIDLKQNEQRLLMAIEDLKDLIHDLEQEKQELNSTREMLLETLKEIAPKEESIASRVLNIAIGVWNVFRDPKTVKSQDKDEWDKIMKEIG